jgi:hypothetical protein
LRQVAQCEHLVEFLKVELLAVGFGNGLDENSAIEASFGESTQSVVDTAPHYRAGAGCLNSFPRKISGFLPGFSFAAFRALDVAQGGLARPKPCPTRGGKF